MIVDFNDEWARRLQAQRPAAAAPRHTRYDGAPTVNGHMHGHGAGEWALRQPELYAWMEAQVCDGCVSPTASGGYPAAEETARTISGPSKLPDEDLGYGLRQDTPLPEGVEVYTTGRRRTRWRTSWGARGGARTRCITRARRSLASNSDADTP